MHPYPTISPLAIAPESLHEHQKNNSFVIVFCRHRIVDPVIVLQGQQYDDSFNSFKVAARFFF